MKKLQNAIAIAAIALALNFSAFAQKVTSNNLPEPAKLHSNIVRGGLFGSNGPDPGTILYGSTPSGSSSNPVLVFIHGYNSNPTTWYDDNDMYSKAYYAGYRTAFVAVNPDKSMWTNGSLFKSMLQTITSYYGVSKVVVIAHSKGGVDTDAASIHYGAHTLIDRVVTLSSPHHGTALADLAHSGWAWWLSAILGQYNDATYVLQRGYMDYYRSVTDSHSNASQVDFRTIGGWGYGGIMTVSGWYLNANGGSSSSGGNDGVVPYYSTKRPGSVELFGGYGDSRTDVDHVEVKTGSDMWQYIQPQLVGASSNLSRTHDRNPDAIIKSSVQIVSTDGGSQSFKVEKGAKNIKIDLREVRTNNNRSSLKIFSPNGSEMNIKNKTTIIRSADPISKEIQFIEIKQPVEGKYTISSENAYIAIITSENGVELTLQNDLNEEKLVYHAGEKMTFDLSIQSNGIADILGANVSGILSLSTNLLGTAPKDEKIIPVKFQQVGTNKYQLVMNGNLNEGVYNLSLHAQNSHFKKSMVTSFAIVEGEIKEDLINENIGLQLNAYPNPFRGIATIRVSIKEGLQNQLNIYNSLGQMVKHFDLSNYPTGNHEIKFDARTLNLQNGIYIYEFSDGNSRATKSMVLIK